MTRIGFLSCADTLPSAGERRGDAFEHDREVAALRPAFAAAGLELVEIDWRAPLAAFDGIALALIGTTWDYQDDAPAFLGKLETLQAAGTRVCNPPALVRWNAVKGYLRDLAAAGASTVPTLWQDDVTAAEVRAAMDAFACDSLVVKRQVGAGGIGQHRFTRDALPAAEWRMGRPAMLQPFLPGIVEEGEYSFVFIDRAFSHALVKRPRAGDYRVQSLYGGVEESWTPPAADLAQAEAVVAAIPFADMLYCRIDMVRLPSGTLAVMEAEAVEPYLYPDQGPQLGERLARAIGKRLAA